MDAEAPRVVDGDQQREDVVDVALRPSNFADFVGQKAVTDNLKVFVQAAKGRGEALDHLLFHGPPGLGKTTLAYIIAEEMGAGITVVQAPALERKGDLAGVLTQQRQGQVLFIDEIHRLNPAVEETLYAAMEDFRFDILLGEGPHAKSIRITLKPFTLIGATTRTGLLTGPLRDRFGYSARLQYYDSSDIELILNRSARLLKIDMDPSGTAEIGARSRGTPRVANRLLRRVRDFAQVEGDGRVDVGVARGALDRLGVDRIGLDQMDRALLEAIVLKFDGGPVGVESLAAAVGETTGAIVDVHEPFLIQQGYLHRTPRGRVVTRRACEHLNLPMPGQNAQAPSQDQGDLF
jgi:Holliday junction DNA helicase RuvB